MQVTSAMLGTVNTCRPRIAIARLQLRQRHPWNRRLTLMRTSNLQLAPANLDISALELPISRETALAVLSCSDTDVPELMAAARVAKEHFKPNVITYSRKVFIPLTNLCRDYCGYCIFRRDPGQPGAHTMTPEEVLEVAHAGEKLGCTEAQGYLFSRPKPVEEIVSLFPRSVEQRVSAA